MKALAMMSARFSRLYSIMQTCLLRMATLSARPTKGVTILAIAADRAELCLRAQPGGAY